jgi:hypothetical protein
MFPKDDGNTSAKTGRTDNVDDGVTIWCGKSQMASNGKYL